MQKYLAIIDRKTGYIILLCIILAYLCRANNFSFDLNITLLSVAVVFPLVFTIREAFKRRDNVIKLLSIFKSSINAVFYCFVINNKLGADKKQYVADKLHDISDSFFAVLSGHEYKPEQVRKNLDEIFCFLDANSDSISNGVSLKIIRFLKDVHESIENTVGVKLHGTPVSLRAYCLVFIYLFPFAFIPSLNYDLNGNDAWVLYFLSIIHGFILISIYNVQSALENPFDQVGLDDIQLEEFHFKNSDFLPQQPSSS